MSRYTGRLPAGPARSTANGSVSGTAPVGGAHPWGGSSTAAGSHLQESAEGGRWQQWRANDWARKLARASWRRGSLNAAQAPSGQQHLSAPLTKFSRERLLGQQAGRRGLPRPGVAAHPGCGALRVRPSHALGSGAQGNSKAQHCGHLQVRSPGWWDRPGSRAVGPELGGRRPVSRCRRLPLGSARPCSTAAGKRCARAHSGPPQWNQSDQPAIRVASMRA